MKVIVGCEYSGRVREAFRKRGHEAYSCDLLPAEDGSPFHFQDDIFNVLAREKFDLGIFHPECTFLCNSGVRWMYRDGFKKNGLDPQRVADCNDGIDFFKRLRDADIRKIALENPIMHGAARGAIGDPDQYVQPWWFGHEAFKATGLHLKNLPLLKPTNLLTPPKPGTQEHVIWTRVVHNAPRSKNRWKDRSRTFQGVADAMAEQWG